MQLNYNETLRGKTQELSSTRTIGRHEASLHGIEPHVPLKEFLDDECLLTCGDYNIRLVNSPRQRSKADLLVKRMYSWRGSNPLLMTPRLFHVTPTDLR